MLYNRQTTFKEELKMETLTRNQVAEILKVSINWLASKKMAERLPFKKDINNRVIYNVKDVQKYIEQYKTFIKE
jgi:hypothetical protein